MLFFVLKEQDYRVLDRDNNGSPRAPLFPILIGREIPTSKSILPFVIILSPRLYSPSIFEVGNP